MNSPRYFDLVEIVEWSPGSRATTTRYVAMPSSNRGEPTPQDENWTPPERQSLWDQALAERGHELQFS